MDSEVENIKRRLDIVAVLSKYLPLKKKGRHYTACCPFHGEKTPSFMVSPELQIYKCFGCGKGGDIFTFIEEYEKVDFREALEELAKMAGVTLEKSAQASQADSHRRRLFEINQEVAKFYHYILTQHVLGQPALKYILGRGITLETIKQFKIGFAPKNSLLISNYLAKKNFYHPDLVATGTFGANKYGRPGLYDRFQGRLIFPLMDYRDRIIGFSGRVLPGESAENAKYINSPETEIYHKSHTVYGLNFAKDSIRSQGFVIVVEGEFDMISPFQKGVTNIIAIKGTAFTQEQLELLRRYTDTLILALDSDFAGAASARRSIELADGLGFDIKVLTLDGRYKDPDEAVSADPQFFRQQLTNAIPIWDFLIQSTIAIHDPSSIKGKREVLSIVLPFISKISNLVIRSDYVRKLALEIGSTPESITQEITKLTQPSSVQKFIPSTKNTTPVAPKKLRLEEYLFSLVLVSKNPHKVIKKITTEIPEIFSLTPIHQKIIDLIPVDPIPSADFHLSLPPELMQAFETAYLKAVSYNYDSDHRKMEVNKTISTILEIELKDQIKQVSQDIALLESRGDEVLLSEKEKEYNQLLSRLQKAKTPRP